MNADLYETRMILDGNDDKSNTRLLVQKQQRQQQQLQRLSERQQGPPTSANQLNTKSCPPTATSSTSARASASTAGYNIIISGSRSATSLSPIVTTSKNSNTNTTTAIRSHFCHQTNLANISEVNNHMTTTSLSSCKFCLASVSVSASASAPTSNTESKSSTTDQAVADLSSGLAEEVGQELDFPQLVDSNSNSFLFWKYLSNLPKSITQRSKSSGSSTLTPEVAGYLLQASKQQCSHKLNSYEQNKILSAESKNLNKSTCRTNNMANTVNMAASSEQQQQLDTAPVSCQRLIKSKPNLMTPTETVLTSTISSNALLSSSPLHSPSPSAATTQALKEYYKESYNQQHLTQQANSNPPEQQQQHCTATSKQQNQRNLNQNQNQNQIKLSIATTTTATTRSSASSLSSCILSGGDDSSTEEVRLKWGKKMDFLLSIIGFAVDLANIWRFPYLVYKNGGGVFLIPYVTMLIFGGIPLFFLELCLGQFVKKGPITVWNKICPSMKGVGYCSILISWYVSFYYNVLIAWSVYFIYRSLLSFGDKMPWEDCDNSWNSKGTCVSISQLKELCSTRNETLESCRKEMFANVNVTSPASEFFVKELSQIDQSTGLDDMGYLRPELVLCTIIVYFLHYFSLFRGLETSGKVVWVTATAPYMILSILLVRGLFLPGASMGIEYYLSPRLEKLADPQVWIDAAGQVFYSIGVGFGVHLTYASFNSHNNNCYRDCLMTSAVNAATSVYSGLVVFVYLGYMAKNLGIEIDKVASEGYSLVFEVYPEALTTLPFARFWSILFFIMLLTLGIDSAMGGLEAVITGLEDEFRFAKRLSRGQLTGLVIVSSFLPALISCTQGGAYTLFWFDIYSAGVSLLFSALFETIGVVYCYGLDKFMADIESMLGKKPHLFYIVCWKYISPIFLGAVIFMSIYTASVPTYRGYTFPLWSIILGWCLAFSSVSAVPIVAGWRWYTHRGKRVDSTDKSARKRRSKHGSNKKSPSPNHRSISVSCSGQTQGGSTMTTRVLTTGEDML